MEPPAFGARTPGTVRAAPGSAATLLLPTPSGTPPFTYRWSRGGVALDERFTTSEEAGGVRLTVSAATTGDSGVYTLQASNAAGSDTTRVRLEVSAEEMPTGEDPPTFLRRLQDLTVKVGTRTRFLVEIVSSTECKVTWYRNERRLLEAERVSLVRDGNLWCADVGAVSVDDAGRWTCTAENEGGRASCSAHLNVLVPKAYKRPEFVEELRALLTEQGTVSLECKVVGVPTPVLRWFKDSREIKAGDVFALTANAEDPTSLGTYTCEAVNCMGRAYSSSKVHVVGRGSRESSIRPSSSDLTPEPPPIFTKELEDQSVKICDPLTLSCNVVVPPWPRSVVWYNKEGKIEPGERYHVLEDGVGGYLLEVPSSEWADEGEWKCVATSAGGRVGISTCYVAMEVPKNYRKPRFMENLQAVLTEEGLVSFECKVVGFPTPVLSWFKDGQELKPGDVYQLTGTNSLGSYCCIARNCMGHASSSAELTVEDIQNQLNEEEKLQLFSKNQAPKFIQGLKSVEAKIDEPFRFTVKVAIPPEPSVLWYRDEQPVDESTRCHLGKEERGVFYLDIQTLEFLDQAEWKCVAVNDFGHSVTSCFLKLIIPRHYKKPRFLENLQAILSEEGAVNLECKVIGVPQPVLKWYKDGEELKPGDIHRIISGQDGTCCLGTYTCEAQNCMGIAASSASLLGFDDSMRAKAKKAEEQALQRNLSLSTIHEERTSQMYDTPVGDITLDDKGEISFSFDGKEVSVSLYETPDLTEEEALQIVEMYADQLSENVTEHNVVELPPLRFVKETSTSGNLLMEAIIIDVSPDYFASPEEDLRTEADVEDISIADENGPPQLSLDQDAEIGGEDYLEKTMALLSDEKTDIPIKMGRKKSDSQKSVDDFFSLSRDQSLSEEKKDDDTHLSESDLVSYESARSSAKIKSKSSKPSLVDGQESSEPTKTMLLKDEPLHISKQENMEQPEITAQSQKVLTVPEIKPKSKRERRSSRGSRKSSSGSEKSLSKSKEELLRFKADIEQLPIKPYMSNDEFANKMENISKSLTKVINNIQHIERDIILKSELMASAATASRSLEIISSLISPLSEIHCIVDAANESVNESKEVTSSIFNNLPQPLRILHQSLTIIEKCIDMESDNKTLVKKTCVAFIETCGIELQKMLSEMIAVTTKDYLQTENKVVNEIDSLASEMISTITFSIDTIQARHLLSEADVTKQEELSLEEKHLKDTQKAVFEFKSPVNSLLRIVENAESGNLVKLNKIKNSDVLLNDMSASIQDLQAALEQIESLSINESTSALQKYNTEIIETVVEPILKLREAFEQMSKETNTVDDKIVLKEVLSSIKQNLTEISSQIDFIERKVGKFDVLQSDNKLNVLQKMAQSLITLENNLSSLEMMPEVQTHMNAFHKNLTKVLEIVIESNDAVKYFTLMEICDAVNRINTSIKIIDSENAMPFASLSNAIRIVQGHFLKNVFESELNCSIITNIADVLIQIQGTINKAEDLNLEIESEYIHELTILEPDRAKIKIIMEQIDQTIAAINTVKTIETTQEIKSPLSPTLERICPILEELKKSVAAIQQTDALQDEHAADLSISSLAQTLATPLCELNQNIVVLNQFLIDNIESLKSNSEMISAIAEPLHELHTTLEIIQQDVISQYNDDMTPYEINVNMESAVQNLHSCMVIIQEQAGVEIVDEISTLEDISNIKTSADTLPSDRLILPIAEVTSIEQSVQPIITATPVSVTAKTLQSLKEHLTVLQTPEVVDALDTLSEVSDLSSLQSVASGIEDLHNAIQTILHPVTMEAAVVLDSFSNLTNLAVIAQPLQELQQSLSVLDTTNIPIYEDILDLPTEKLHSVIQSIFELKEQLNICNETVLPAVDLLNNTFEISTKVSTLRDVCSNLKDVIDTAKVASCKIITPEINQLEDVVESLLKATDISKGIKIDEIKCITEELFEKVVGVQEEIIQFTSHPLTKLSQEAELVKIVSEVENHIAVLQQYDFVDLSRVSDLSSCTSPQSALEIESESLALMADIVENAVNVVQDCSQETPIADLMIVEEFFKTCKNEFTILKCLITKSTSHKKIIRLIDEFKSLQTLIHGFKTKRFDLKLSDDINGCLATFLLHADDCTETILRSLEKIIESQSEILITTPIAKIQDVALLKENSESYKDTAVYGVIEKLFNIIDISKPLIINIQENIFQELKYPSQSTSHENILLIKEVEEFTDLIVSQSSLETIDVAYKELLKKLLNSIEKHQDMKDASSVGKTLILLKFLSECVDIIKEGILKETQTIENSCNNEKESTLKDILTEMLQPLQALQTQLLSIREQVVSGADEDSISFDITSTESLVNTMTELHKDIVQQIESEKSTVDNEDISLIMEVDKEIHTIQDSIKSLENIEAAQVVKEITKPMENIEKSLHDVLTSEKDVQNVQLMSKDINSNLGSLEMALERFINIKTDLLAASNLFNIDINKTVQLAVDLIRFLNLTVGESNDRKVIKIKYGKMYLLEEILSKFDWLNTDCYLLGKSSLQIEKLRKIFLTAYQLLSELNSAKLLINEIYTCSQNGEKSADLLQHIDQYIEFIEIVEEISAVIKVENLRETFEMARELKEVIITSESAIKEDNNEKNIGETLTEQARLATRLQKSLSTLQVQLLDSAQELAPVLSADILQRIARVTVQLQADLIPVTGIQMTFQAPLLAVETVGSIKTLIETPIAEIIEGETLVPEKTECVNIEQIGNTPDTTITIEVAAVNTPIDKSALYQTELIDSVKEQVQSALDKTESTFPIQEVVSNLETTQENLLEEIKEFISYKVVNELSTITNLAELKNAVEIAQKLYDNISAAETPKFSGTSDITSLNVSRHQAKLALDLRNSVMVLQQQSVEILQELAPTINKEALQNVKEIVNKLSSNLTVVINIHPEIEKVSLITSEEQKEKIMEPVQTTEEKLEDIAVETIQPSTESNLTTLTLNMMQKTTEQRTAVEVPQLAISKSEHKAKEVLVESTLSSTCTQMLMSEADNKEPDLSLEKLGDNANLTTLIKESAVKRSGTVDKNFAEQQLVQHINEFVADEITEVVEEISNITNVDALKESVLVAKELRECILRVDNSTMGEVSNSFRKSNFAEEMKLTRKLQNALSTLHTQALESAELITPMIKSELLQRVFEAITQLQDDLAIAVESNFDSNFSKIIQSDGNPDVFGEQNAMNQLVALLQDLNNMIRLSTSGKKAEDIETLKDTLDEVLTVIMKLKRDYDGAVNDTLSETLDDLECSVRSVQLQINEDSRPELLLEACETLQLLANNITITQERNNSSMVKNVPLQIILENCFSETNETLKLLEAASGIEPKDNSNLSNIISNLNHLTDCLKSLKRSLLCDADTLIENGINITQCLVVLEDQVFSLEKDINVEKTLLPNARDNIVTAVHAVYGSISNMRSTFSSIQKRYMFENYGQPSELLLHSIKNINVILNQNKDLVSSDWKKFSKSIRKVLNHFEDIKFYINLDKTARLPSDSAFTKIILEELKMNISNVLMPQGMQLGSLILERVYKTITCIEQNIKNINEQTSLEVKNKIPMFRDIAIEVFNVTSKIKDTLQEINMIVEQSVAESPVTSNVQLISETDSMKSGLEKDFADDVACKFNLEEQPSTECTKAVPQDDDFKTNIDNASEKQNLSENLEVQKEYTVPVVAEPSELSIETITMSHVLQAASEMLLPETSNAETSLMEDTLKEYVTVTHLYENQCLNSAESLIQAITSDDSVQISDIQNSEEACQRKHLETQKSQKSEVIAVKIKEDEKSHAAGEEENLNTAMLNEENEVTKANIEANLVEEHETTINISVEVNQTASEAETEVKLQLKKDKEKDKNAAEEVQKSAVSKQEEKDEKAKNTAQKEKQKTDKINKGMKLEQKEKERAKDVELIPEEKNEKTKKLTINEKEEDEKTKQKKNKEKEIKQTKENEEAKKSSKEEKQNFENVNEDVEVKQKSEVAEAKNAIEEEKQTVKKVKQEVELLQKQENAEEEKQKAKNVNDEAQLKQKDKEENAKIATEEEKQKAKIAELIIKQKEVEAKRASEEENQNTERVKKEIELNQQEKDEKTKESVKQISAKTAIKEADLTQKQEDEKVQAAVEEERQNTERAELKQEQEQQKATRTTEEDKQNAEKLIKKVELKQQELDEKAKISAEAEKQKTGQKTMKEPELKQKKEDEKGQVAAKEEKQNVEQAELKQKQVEKEATKSTEEDKQNVEIVKKEIKVKQHEADEKSEKSAKEDKQKTDEKTMKESQLKQKKEDGEVQRAVEEEMQKTEKQELKQKHEEGETKKATEEENNKAKIVKNETELKQNEENEKTKKTAEAEKRSATVKTIKETELKQKEENEKAKIIAEEEEQKAEQPELKQIQEEKEATRETEKDTQNGEMVKKEIEVEQHQADEKTEKAAEEEKQKTDEKTLKESQLKQKKEDDEVQTEVREEKQKTEKQELKQKQEEEKAKSATEEENNKVELVKNQTKLKQKEEDEKAKKTGQAEKQSATVKTMKEAELKQEEMNEKAKTIPEKEEQKAEQPELKEKQEEKKATRATEEDTQNGEIVKKENEVKQHKADEKSEKAAEEEKQKTDEKTMKESQLKQKKEDDEVQTEVGEEKQKTEKQELKQKQEEEKAKSATEEENNKVELVKNQTKLKQKEEDEKAKKTGQAEKQSATLKTMKEAELKQEEVNENAKTIPENEEQKAEQPELKQIQEEKEATRVTEEDTQNGEMVKKEIEVKQHQADEKAKKAAEEEQQKTTEKIMKESELKQNKGNEELQTTCEEEKQNAEKQELKQEQEEREAKRAKEEENKTAEKVKKETELKQKEEYKKVKITAEADTPKAKEKTMKETDQKHKDKDEKANKAAEAEEQKAEKAEPKYNQKEEKTERAVEEKNKKIKIVKKETELKLKEEDEKAKKPATGEKQTATVKESELKQKNEVGIAKSAAEKEKQKAEKALLTQKEEKKEVTKATEKDKQNAEKFKKDVEIIQREADEKAKKDSEFENQKAAEKTMTKAELNQTGKNVKVQTAVEEKMQKAEKAELEQKQEENKAKKATEQNNKVEIVKNETRLKQKVEDEKVKTTAEAEKQSASVKTMQEAELKQNVENEEAKITAEEEKQTAEQPELKQKQEEKEATKVTEEDKQNAEKVMKEIKVKQHETDEIAKKPAEVDKQKNAEIIKEPEQKQQQNDEKAKKTTEEENKKAKKAKKETELKQKEEGEKVKKTAEADKQKVNEKTMQETELKQKDEKAKKAAEAEEQEAEKIIKEAELKQQQVDEKFIKALGEEKKKAEKGKRETELKQNEKDKKAAISNEAETQKTTKKAMNETKLKQKEEDEKAQIAIEIEKQEIEKAELNQKQEGETAKRATEEEKQKAEETELKQKQEKEKAKIASKEDKQNAEKLMKDIELKHEKEEQEKNAKKADEANKQRLEITMKNSELRQEDEDEKIEIVAEEKQKAENVNEETQLKEKKDSNSSKITTKEKNQRADKAELKQKQDKTKKATEKEKSNAENLKKETKVEQKAKDEQAETSIEIEKQKIAEKTMKEATLKQKEESKKAQTIAEEETHMVDLMELKQKQEEAEDKKEKQIAEQIKKETELKHKIEDKKVKKAAEAEELSAEQIKKEAELKQKQVKEKSKEIIEEQKKKAEKQTKENELKRKEEKEKATKSAETEKQKAAEKIKTEAKLKQKQEDEKDQTAFEEKKQKSEKAELKPKQKEEEAKKEENEKAKKINKETEVKLKEEDEKATKSAKEEKQKVAEKTTKEAKLKQKEEEENTQIVAKKEKSETRNQKQEKETSKEAFEEEKQKAEKLKKETQLKQKKEDEKAKKVAETEKQKDDEKAIKKAELRQKEQHIAAEEEEDIKSEIKQSNKDHKATKKVSELKQHDKEKKTRKDAEDETEQLVKVQKDVELKQKEQNEKTRKPAEEETQSIKKSKAESKQKDLSKVIIKAVEEQNKSVESTKDELKQKSGSEKVKKKEMKEDESKQIAIDVLKDKSEKSEKIEQISEDTKQEPESSQRKMSQCKTETADTVNDYSPKTKQRHTKLDSQRENGHIDHKPACTSSSSTYQQVLDRPDHHYIKEYQYEPSATRLSHDIKEIPRFIDHNHKDYTLEFARPAGYRERSYDIDVDRPMQGQAIQELGKNSNIYKAQTIILDAQLRSSSSPYLDINRDIESSHRKTEIRQRSKALSEARSLVSDKKSGISRDSKRKPIFSTYLTDRTAVEGSRVKLTCSVLSSTDPSISWYKNGVLLENKLKYRTKYVDGLITLEVLNAVPSDSAEYSCSVTNENGSVSSSANLKVYPSFEASPIPPTFTRSIRDNYHLAENELVLECRIRGQPLPTITWWKDDRPIESNERFQAYYLADGVCRLAIESPTPEDSGKYTCKAENSVWSDQITHVVTFTGKESRVSPNIATIEKSRFNRQAMESRRPHFTNVLNDYKVTKGGTIGLQVEIRGAPTSVEWLREGRSVTEIYRNARTFVEQGLYTLALTDVTEKESGMYTCRAWSAHGNVDMNAAITVVQPNELEGKPAIIVGRPEKDILISVGEDINISFRVQGEPKPKVIFMKGIRDITTSQRVCKMTSDDYVKFTLKRSIIADAGTYCILARNAYGCDRAFVTVVVRQRASSDHLISDWTYSADDSSTSITERNYKSVPERIPNEPTVVDGGSNWVSLSWPKPDPGVSAPVLAFRVESWLLGKEGGARWTELGITPLNSFDAFNLKQGEEYHFRVTPRNRYGWGESVQTSRPVAVGLAGDRPEFVDILPGQLKVLGGETAKLHCSVKGKPTPEIAWMKNGHEIEEESGRVSITFNGFECGLTIKDICSEDEARYSCEATNVHGRSSTYARLAVVTDRMVWEADAKLKRERSADACGEYPPQFTMRLRDRRVQATYPVRLTCQVIGSPPPTITWYKDGEQVENDKRHTQSQDEHFHTLEIAPTALEDGGVYEVLARNSSGAVSCRCSLVVDKGIRAYVAPEFCCGLEPHYRVSDGDELRISAVVEAYPSVGVSWYRDGVRLRPSRRAVMTLDRDGQIELALAAVTHRDAGVYTCTASNEVGRASTSGKVEVVGGEVKAKKSPPVLLSPDVPYSKEPMFIRKPRSSSAREGDTVIIQCEVVGDPKPDVYWLRDFLKPDYYRDATHFRRVGLGPKYRFEIPHAKLDYTGAYSVVARNIHGEAKAVISLQILAKDPTSPEEAHNIRYGEVEVLPRFEKELTDLLSCDGDAVEFECRVSGHPTPDIRWFHYHELIRESEDFEWTFEEGSARLKIRHVTAEDEGTYTCEAANCLGKAASSACLVVYPAGEPNTLCQRLRRPAALLSCTSTPRSTPRTTPARSLSRARTPGPDSHRLCSPARQMAPTFYTYPFNKVAEEGDTVTLQCAVKGLPAPWATWDKDGIIITPSSRITLKEKDEILRILEIEQVTVEDVGVYRITVENEFGRAEASARLEVITQSGKFYGGVRGYSPSPRRSLSYRSRRPSTPRQD